MGIWLRKRRKVILLSLLCLSACTALHSGSVTAWSNGSYASNEVAYDWEEDYGTHDWVAEGALDELLQENASAWHWLEARIDIYLLGTEAPDNAGVEAELNGDTVEGFGDNTWHHIYLEWDNGSIVEDDAALRAKSMGDLANIRLGEGKEDQAAFYLGAMTHYIADVAMFAHAAENDVYPHYLDFDYDGDYYVHGMVEDRVQARTNDYQDREEFFEYSDHFPSPQKPYDEAVDLANDTFRDPDGAGSHSAVWLRENYFTDWALDRSSETNDTKIAYYDRIEENLNNAVRACASAMLSAVGANSPVSDPGDQIPGFTPLALALASLAVAALLARGARSSG